MILESLVGKNIIEVILELPKFDWTLNDYGRIIKPKISTIFFVGYEKRKPREYIDLFTNIKSLDLSLENLKRLNLVDYENRRCAGLISKVQLGEPYTEEEGIFAHIPMIDFDTDELTFFKDGELLELLKRMIKEKTELDQGVLLKSGPRNNYHFIGTNRLFSEDDFITFCGLCLGMKYKKDGRNFNLVDSRHIGHALGPMKYIAEIERRAGKNWSAYDIKSRFATLRITPKRKEDDLPKVVEVLR